MNKFRIGKIIFSTLLAVFAASAGFSQDEYVKVKASGAVLKGQYGEMKCPEGTILKVKSKGDETYQVSGEVFGMKVEGSLLASDVEPVNPVSPQENNGNTNIKKNNAADNRNNKTAEPEKTDPKSITYLGKAITPDFASFFYDKMREIYSLKNINGDELVQGKSPKIVDNIDKCKKLVDGDIVVIDGTVKIETPSFYIVGISDVNYSQQNQNVVVFKKKPDPDFKTNWDSRKGFKIHAVSGSKQNGPTPEHFNIELSEYKFDEISPDDTFFSIQRFVETLTAGKEYKIDCPNCDGKGEKNKIRCTMCGGKKQLTGNKALDRLLKEFKKESK